jgi:L-fuculose-phosphate aldolase
MLLEQLRTEVIVYSNRMIAKGLTRGTGGNISCIDRTTGLVAITPSGVAYDKMKPEDVPLIDLNGKVRHGDLVPSSEFDMHLACYQARADVQAVVHTHSTYATVMACLRKPIEAIHYLVGFAGGPVSVTPYLVFGTKKLAQAAVETMGKRNAVLLGNHGLLAVGKDLGSAFNVAEEIEFVAELNYKTLCVGGGIHIEEALMKETMEKFDTYGQVKETSAV